MVIYIETDGLSPATVQKLTNDKRTVYLKSIEAIYDHTTYSVKREMEVIKWLNGKLSVPDVMNFYDDGQASYLLMNEVKGRPIDTLKNSPELKFLMDNGLADTNPEKQVLLINGMTLLFALEILESITIQNILTCFLMNLR